MLLSVVGWLLLALLGLMVLGGIGGAFVMEGVFLFFFGWIGFLSSNLRSLEFNPRLAAEAVACVVALGVGGHWFARWLWAAMAPAENGPWRPRWTVLLLASVLFLFVSGIATIGVVHQAGWLVKQGALVEDSFTARLALSAMVERAAKGMAAVEAFHARAGRLPGSLEEAAIGEDPRRNTAVLKSIGPAGRITVEPVPELRLQGSVVLVPAIENGRLAWTCESTLGRRHAARACQEIDERR